jgi:enoyl-CoA hydratase/carnithine racemase
MGLVDGLVEAGRLDVETLSLADRLAGGPTEALAAIVRCVDAAGSSNLGEGMAVERQEVMALFGSTDGREGVSAFLEKRSPRFGS